MKEHRNLLSYTNQAFTRVQEQGIKPDQVDYVVVHGTHYPQADGTVKCVLKPANVPYADLWSHAALVGLTVVLAVLPHGRRRMVTLYFGDKPM